MKKRMYTKWLLLAGMLLWLALPTGALAESNELVGVDDNEIPANAESFGTAMSSNGRFVIFASAATNLTTKNTWGKRQVYLRDRQNGLTKIISVNNAGDPGNNHSYVGGIDDAGTYIVFSSFATNLTAVDTNNTIDVFIHNTKTGETKLVSKTSTGAAGNAYSSGPTITGDGRTILFYSVTTDLVSADLYPTNTDLFLYDTQSEQLSYAVLTTQGTQANGEKRYGHIAKGGRYLSFQTDSTNLGPSANGYFQIYLYDLIEKKATLISKAADGALGNNHSGSSQVDDAGNVVFDSRATNLPGGAGGDDLFLRNPEMETTIRIGSALGFFEHAFSRNGRYVAYTPAGAEGKGLKVYEVATGAIWRADVADDGTPGNGTISRYPSISGDGTMVGFYTTSTNIHPSGADGVYVHNQCICP